MGQSVQIPGSAIRTLLVADTGAERDEVKERLAGLPDPRLDLSETTPDAQDNPVADQADVAMVVFNGNEDASLAYLKRVKAQPQHPAVVALLHERSAALMRKVLRAGADELLFLPLDSGEATRALVKISMARAGGEREPGGQITAVTSLSGGVGVTTAAANLALALRYGRDARVALVDLDLQVGGLATYFNLDPEASILPLTKLERKLDSLQLEAALTRHRSGVFLLAAPRRLEDSELISDLTVTAVLELLRTLFDHVVVDCGSSVNENAVAAWEHSSAVLYTLDQSIHAARCACRFSELFGRLGINAITPKVILNRFSSAHPIGEKQIAQVLGQPVFAKIPRDDKTLEKTFLRGTDLWQLAPGAPLTRSYDELARKISAASGPAAVEAKGLIGRLLKPRATGTVKEEQ